MAKLSPSVIALVRSSAAAAHASRPLGALHSYRAAIRREPAAQPLFRAAAEGASARAAFLRAHPAAAAPVALDLVLEARAAALPGDLRIGLLNDDQGKAMAYASRMIEVYGPKPGPAVEAAPVEFEVVPVAPVPSPRFASRDPREILSRGWSFAAGNYRREPAFEIRPVR